MAYALTTTKRKFHRILDSISNSSTTSLTSKTQPDDSTATTLTESPAKKPRVIHSTRHANASVSMATHKSSEVPKDVQASRAVTGRKSSDEKRSKKPNYTPWDRHDFLERLKTFQDAYNWMTKPDKVNEVQWAKRGWRCVGRNRVACASCGREVVMTLEPEESIFRESEDTSDNDDVEWRHSAQEELIEQYAGKIITAHGEDCLWRTKGCDASIQRLPLVHPATTLKDLRLRYESFVKLKSQLPSSLKLPANFNFELSSRPLSSLLLESRIPDTSTNCGSPAQSLDEEALKFALFGWHAESEQNLQIATCDACFRRLGLWLFVPRARSQGSPGGREAIVSRLDLVEEHRSYCPWVNLSAQSARRGDLASKESSSEQAGWQMLARVIENAQNTASALMDDDEPTGLGSPLSTSTNIDKTLRDAQDQERWSKLKKLKQVFRVKRVKGAKKDEVVRPRTAG